MKRILQNRLVRIVAVIVFLASCGSGNDPSSATIEPTGISLTAPQKLKNAVDSDVLFVEIILSYNNGSELIEIPQTVARTANSDRWDISLDVPINTEFVLDITWFDTLDGQRLDLITLRRTISPSAVSGRIVLVFDFTEFDSDDFNDDADEFTNLEERINGTSPFAPAVTDRTRLIEGPVITRYEEKSAQELAFTEEQLGGFSLVESSWTPRAFSAENNEACKLEDGFDVLLSESSLEEACTTLDDCDLTFDQVVQNTQTDGGIQFSIDVPSLKAPVALAYDLETTNTAQETNSVLFYFCLIAVNEPPIANDDNFTVIAGTPLVVTAEQGVNLLSNDTDDLDVSNLPLFISTTPASSPQRATSFVLQTDGGFSYSYSPDDSSAQGSLTDSFAYTVSDGTFSRDATVTLNIVIRDQPPILVSEIPAQSTVVGMALNVDLAVFFEDPENAELSFRTVAGTLPPSGGVSVSELGVLSGVAQPGDEGTYSVEVEARDQQSSVTGILSLEVIENQRPIARPIEDIGPLESGELVSVNVSQSFSDPEGAALRFSLRSEPDSALQINPTTGLISGRVADAGVYVLSVSASDGVTDPATSSFNLTQNALAVGVLGVVNPNSLELSAEVNTSDTGSISFSNIGTAPLSFSIRSDQTWLTATPASGTVAVDGRQAVQVTARCEALATTQTGSLTVEGAGGTRVVSVSTRCTERVAAELSVITPSSLALRANVNASATGTFSFRNIGTAPLNFSIGSDQDWLTARPATGDVAVDGGQEILVSAQCGEAPSTRSGSLLIEGNFEARSVPVTIVCSEPPRGILRVAPNILRLGTSLNSSVEGTIRISNLGNGPLSYDIGISPNQPWLTADPVNGTVGSEGSEVVTVTGECGSEITTLIGTLSINDGSANVEVVLTCRGPALTDLTSSFDLDATILEAARETLSFTNSGTELLQFKVSNTSDWLCLPDGENAGCTESDVVSGELQPGASAQIPFIAICEDDGDYSVTGSLIIDGNIDAVEVPVTLGCTAIPDSIYKELQLNTPVTGSVLGEGSGSSGQSDFYFVTGANFILLSSSSGDADLFIYSDEERTRLLCESSNGDRFDGCELSGNGTVYIQVSGFSSAEYTLTGALAENLEVGSSQSDSVLKGDLDFYRVSGANEVSLVTDSLGVVDLAILQFEAGSGSSESEFGPVSDCAKSNVGEESPYFCSILAETRVYYVLVLGVVDASYRVSASLIELI